MRRPLPIYLLLLVWRQFAVGHVDVYTHITVAALPEEVPGDPDDPDPGVEDRRAFYHILLRAGHHEVEEEQDPQVDQIDDPTQGDDRHAEELPVPVGGGFPDVTAFFHIREDDRGDRRHA